MQSSILPQLASLNAIGTERLKSGGHAQRPRSDDNLDRIERSGAVFTLSSRDENQLRNAGVGEDVIRAMKDTGRR